MSKAETRLGTDRFGEYVHKLRSTIFIAAFVAEAYLPHPRTGEQTAFLACAGLALAGCVAPAAIAVVSEAPAAPTEPETRLTFPTAEPLKPPSVTTKQTVTPLPKPVQVDILPSSTAKKPPATPTSQEQSKPTKVPKTKDKINTETRIDVEKLPKSTWVLINGNGKNGTYQRVTSGSFFMKDVPGTLVNTATDHAGNKVSIILLDKANALTQYLNSGSYTVIDDEFNFTRRYMPSVVLQPAHKEEIELDANNQHYAMVVDVITVLASNERLGGTGSYRVFKLFIDGAVNGNATKYTDVGVVGGGKNKPLSEIYKILSPGSTATFACVVDFTGRTLATLDDYEKNYPDLKERIKALRDFFLAVGDNDADLKPPYLLYIQDIQALGNGNYASDTSDR